MKLNRTPLAAALCCMALASGSALAAGDSTTGSNASSMDRGTSASPMDSNRMGSASTHMNSQTVRQVQQALRDKGHNPGPIDGMMGPRTQAALQAYQRSEKLSGASGLDERTLEALGVQASGGMGSMGTPSARGAGDAGSSAGGTGGTMGGTGGTGKTGGMTTDPATTPGGTGSRSGTGGPSGTGSK